MSSNTENYILYFSGFFTLAIGITNMILAFMDKSKFDRPKKLRLTNAAFIFFSGLTVLMIPLMNMMYSAGPAFLSLMCLVLSSLVAFKVF